MKKRFVALLTGAMLMMATSAMAIPILDFGMVAPTAGSITYAGGAAPLVGVGINVDNVLGLDTVLNDGIAFNLLGAVLNFTTGNVISSTATTASFGGGGTISLTGTVDVDNSGTVNVGDISGLLMNGSFGNVQVSTTSGQFRLAGSGFQDVKDPDLLALYGLPNINYEGTFSLSFRTTGDLDLSNGFASATLLSGDIFNTPVPEPGTMMLLGFGMLGLAVYGKRRMNKEA